MLELHKYLLHSQFAYLLAPPLPLRIRLSEARGILKQNWLIVRASVPVALEINPQRSSLLLHLFLPMGGVGAAL